MAGPLDLLKKGYQFATTPVVSKETVDPILDMIDHPTMERTPWQARVHGFQAGALDGLRQQLTPLNIALAAIPGMGAARGAQGAVAGARAADVVGEGTAAATSLPEVVGVGEEAVHNAGRAARAVPQPTLDGFYQDMMKKFGGLQGR